MSGRPATRRTLSRPAADLGPRERHRKPDRPVPEPGSRPGTVRLRVQTQTALERYCLRGQLDPADPAENRRRFDAGQRLLRDWLLAGMEAPQTAHYADRVDGTRRPDVTGGAEDARRRFRLAIRAVGKVAAGETIEVCCTGNPVGRTGLEILRRGLAVLADHYESEGRG